MIREYQRRGGEKPLKAEPEQEKQLRSRGSASLDNDHRRPQRRYLQHNGSFPPIWKLAAAAAFWSWRWYERSARKRPMKNLGITAAIWEKGLGAEGWGGGKV